MASHAVSTAQILPFCRPKGVGNDLTVADRIEALAWAPAGSGRDYRLAITNPGANEPVGLGSTINIYRAGQIWPYCTIMREAGELRAWRTKDGVDIGVFPSVRAALMAILAEGGHVRATRAVAP